MVPCCNEYSLLTAQILNEFVSDGISHRQIIEKSVSIRQLSVVEAHGILLFRADKGNITD